MPRHRPAVANRSMTMASGSTPSARSVASTRSMKGPGRRCRSRRRGSPSTNAAMAAASTNPLSRSRWWRTSNRSGCRACRLLQPLAEDDRVRVPVGVQEATDRSDVAASTLLAMEITGVMPLPPQKAMIGRPPSRDAERARRPVTSTRSPSETWSMSQLETTPSAHALDGDDQVAVGLGSTRHRVAAGVLRLARCALGTCRTARVGTGTPLGGRPVPRARTTACRRSRARPAGPGACGSRAGARRLGAQSRGPARLARSMRLCPHQSHRSTWRRISFSSADACADRASLGRSALSPSPLLR